MEWQFYPTSNNWWKIIYQKETSEFHSVADNCSYHYSNKVLSVFGLQVRWYGK